MTPGIMMRALSIRQPWCDAILHGGKRVENRLKWTACAFRGPLLLHASKGCTRREYREVQRFAEERGLAWRPPPLAELVRGALVGWANVVDVVPLDHGQRQIDSQAVAAARLSPYYMGRLALVLDDVEAWEEPIPWVGSLGFFRVPESVVGMGT